MAFFFLSLLSIPFICCGGAVLKSFFFDCDLGVPALLGALAALVLGISLFCFGLSTLDDSSSSHRMSDKEFEEEYNWTREEAGEFFEGYDEWKSGND